MGLKLMIVGKGKIDKTIHLALRVLSSEYLPAMLVYNTSNVNLQESPSPLRELIIPNAALALMGPASNISSRILKPMFI